MSTRRLGIAVLLLGAVVIVAAVSWWAHYYASHYSRIVADGSFFDALGCLLYSDERCRRVGFLARVAGRTPYEPMLLWLGALTAAAGAALAFLHKSRS